MWGSLKTKGKRVFASSVPCNSQSWRKTDIWIILEAERARMSIKKSIKKRKTPYGLPSPRWLFWGLKQGSFSTKVMIGCALNYYSILSYRGSRTWRDIDQSPSQQCNDRWKLRASLTLWTPKFGLFFSCIVNASPLRNRKQCRRQRGHIALTILSFVVHNQFFKKEEKGILREHVLPSAPSLKFGRHEQTKLPSVLLHIWPQPPLFCW